MAFYVIMIIFLACFAAVGLINRKRASAPMSFFLGNKRGSTFIITGSLLATILGGSSTLGLAGLGFLKGLPAVWWLLSGSAGLFVLAVFFVKGIKENDAVTLPELIEQQYQSRAMGIIAALLILISWTGIISGQIIAVGRILSSMHASSLNSIIVAVGFVIIFYTALGGQYSILKTDALQFFIIVAGLVITVFFCYRTMDFTSLAAKLPEEYFKFPVSENFSVKNLFYFLSFVGMTYIIGPDIYSRIFSARDCDTARKSLLITGFMLIPLAFFIVITGMYARALFPAIAPESAFPEVIMKLLPGILGALVMAALLTALISSADTCLLTAGTIVTVNIIGPITGMGRSDQRHVGITRICIVIIGTVSIIVALFSAHIISTLLFAYAVFVSSLAAAVVFGPFARRLHISGTGALLSVFAGGSVGITFKLLDNSAGALAAFPLACAVLLISGFTAKKRSQA